MKISCCLIVKNESSCLATALESVKEADEIIVCDTGSVDNTIEIAKKYTDKVYDDYVWADSFCDARNYSLSKATGDFILTIDADEKLEVSMDLVRKVAQQAEDKGVMVVDITSYSGPNSNKSPRLFKNCSEVFYEGAIHNTLSINGQMNAPEIRIHYGYSKAHELDPDRSLRILQKEVDKGGKYREVFYLAREYWYRKNYDKAIWYCLEYLKPEEGKGFWLPEKAECYLLLAKCYWWTQKGDKARENCMYALTVNSNFKEALLLMAEMSRELSAKGWRKYAEIADNEDVLFNRTNNEI